MTRCDVRGFILPAKLRDAEPLERVAVDRIHVFSRGSEAAFAQQMRSGHPLNAINCNTL